MTPVTITGGAKAAESAWGWNVPKKDLIEGAGNCVLVRTSES